MEEETVATDATVIAGPRHSEAAVLLAEGRKAEAVAKAREGLHAAEHRSLSPVRNLTRPTRWRKYSAAPGKR
jgi:hypothetical protein